MGGITGLITHELLQKIASLSPLLGAALGSPLAGMALSLISSAFGFSSIDQNALLEAIKTDPSSALKLKQIEIEHSEELQRIASTDYQTEVNDRISARNREMTLKDYVPTILAIGFLFNYAIIQFYCVMHPQAEIDIISARFQDVLIMIISYYFGSSHHPPMDKK